MMPRFFVRTVLIVVFMIVLSPTHAETKAWGWRGDGTGRFPEADPPLKWGRISKTVKGLRNSAEKLSKADLGKARTMEHGTIREWLILGPVAADVKVRDLVGKEQIEGEAHLQPKAGDIAGGARWRKVETPGTMLFFNQAAPDPSAPGLESGEAVDKR